MPEVNNFRDAESYYATLAHETTHNAVARIMPHDSVKSWDSKALRHGHSA
jgi:antirestriction protein ArdC